MKSVDSGEEARGQALLHWGSQTRGQRRRGTHIDFSPPHHIAHRELHREPHNEKRLLNCGDDGHRGDCVMHQLLFTFFVRRAERQECGGNGRDVPSSAPLYLL